MIKRTVEISREPAYLSLRNRQLLVKRGNEIVDSIPCEDLGMVIVDHPQVSYSHAALASLVEADAVVVICGQNHLPQGLLIPFVDHSEVVWRLQDQIDAPKPTQKQIWKQVVQAKIRAQAGMLDKDSVPRRKLETLAKAVLSGDTQNHEGQAARIYWSSWLTNVDDENPSPEELDHYAEETFRRDRFAGGLNILLNYGYAILRAAVARAIVGAGLHPAIGIHHSNRGNPFCLADDLMEPLRPLVDRRARHLGRCGEPTLDQHSKAGMLQVLTEEVRFGQESGPLLVVLQRYLGSFLRCLQQKTRKLEIPEALPWSRVAEEEEHAT